MRMLKPAGTYEEDEGEIGEIEQDCDWLFNSPDLVTVSFRQCTVAATVPAGGFKVLNHQLRVK